MSQEIDTKRFLKNPDLLIELCREVIGQLVDGIEKANLGEKDAQLREISRTIERLDKAGVSIPDVLRSEKTNLAAHLGIKNEGLLALNRLADEFEDILKDLNTRLGRDDSSKKSKKPRGKRSNSPKTDKKILRQHIILALKKMNGRARVADVIEEMGRQLSGKLLPGDLEWRASTKEFVWQNNARWERYTMTQDGILRSDSQSGYWELNEDQK